MKTTLTTPKQIEAFLTAEGEKSDPIDFKIVLKPLTAKIWTRTDGTGRPFIGDLDNDSIGGEFLFAISKGKAINISCTANNSDGFIIECDCGDSLSINAQHVVSIEIAKVRVVSDPMPAPFQPSGLQYRLEGIDDGGARGFKAGCNRVTNEHAISTLKWLAEVLGYTVKAKSQAKPAAKS